MENKEEVDRQIRILKNNLRKSILRAIDKKDEFGLLERYCVRSGLEFKEQDINLCLDRYNKMIKEGEEKDKSLYVSLWDTSWYILFYKT